jgi:hypothetical protein
MSRAARWVAVLPCLILLEGCVSNALYVTTPVWVHLIDASTHSPITGAKVTVLSQVNFVTTAVTYSDLNGVAFIDSLKGRSRVFPMMDIFIKPSAVTIEANGYKGVSFVTRPPQRDGGPDEILLEK